MKKTNNTTPLTDPHLAALATVTGGRLERIDQDPASGRLTFVFENLPPTFMRDAFNGELTVNVRDFIAALDQVMGLIHQYKARGRR